MSNRQEIIDALEVCAGTNFDKDRVIETVNAANRALALLQEGEEGRSEGEGVGDAAKSGPGQRSNLSAEPERISAHVPIAPAHNLPPHEPDHGRPGNPIHWCERCRIDAEQATALARQFHEAYERLAPCYGYVTRAETRVFSTDSQNGRLMIAVCREVLSHPMTPSNR